LVCIIFVFDPLAVLLLIAAQYTFEFRRKELEDDDGERLRLERAEYERARAQAIVDNPVFNIDTPAPPAEQKEEVNDVIDRLSDEQSDRQDSDPRTDTGDNSSNAGDDIGTVEGHDQPSGAGHDGGDDSDRVDGDEETVVTVEKKESKSQEELKREADYELKERDEIFQLNKATWKDANPNQTLKHYKHLYVKGLIDSLPWERTAEDDNYNVQEGYQQNAEQSESTLFNKLSKK